MSAVAGVIAIIVFSLFFSALFLEILDTIPKRFRVPFSVVLFVFGVVLGAINRTDGFRCEVKEEGQERHVEEKEEGDEGGPKFVTYGLGCFLGVGADHLAGIGPDTILLVLLPPILFLSTFEVNWHTLRRTLLQSIALAFPGVGISIILLALYNRFALIGLEWTWYQALLLGSILAATDPVAVVAALRELGAPEKLTTIIEGESLLNDGSAFVVFLIFKDLLVAEEAGLEQASAAASIGRFFQLAVLGPLFGVLMGVVAHFWTRTVYNSVVIETTISLVGAYVTFWLAEEILHISAVLAVVSYGFYYAYRGRFALSPEVDESVERFWRLVSWFAESLVFVIAGLITYDAVFATQLAGEGLIWANLVIMYLVLTAVRFLMVFLLLPLLGRMGGSLGWKHAVVIGYGGLRGVVSLILALIVTLEVSDKQYGDTVLFFVAGIVALTLLVNGMTADFVYDALHIVKPSPATLALFNHALAILDDDLDLVYHRLQGHWFYKTANWDRLQYVIPQFRRVTFKGQKISFEWPKIGWLFHGVPKKVKATLDKAKADETLDRELNPGKHHRSRNPERRASFAMPRFLRPKKGDESVAEEEPQAQQEPTSGSGHQPRLKKRASITYSIGSAATGPQRPHYLQHRRRSTLSSRPGSPSGFVPSPGGPSPDTRRLRQLSLQDNLRNTLVHIDMEENREQVSQRMKQAREAGIFDYDAMDSISMDEDVAKAEVEKHDDAKVGRDTDDEKSAKSGRKSLSIKEAQDPSLAAPPRSESLRSHKSPVMGIPALEVPRRTSLERAPGGRPSLDRASSILPAFLTAIEGERYRVFLNAVKARYHRQYHAGFLHDTAMAHLVHSIDAAADEESDHTSYSQQGKRVLRPGLARRLFWRIIGHRAGRSQHTTDHHTGIDLENPRRIDLELQVLLASIKVPARLHSLTKTPVLQWFANGLLYQHLHETVEALLGFINAHQAILQECDEELDALHEVADIGQLAQEIESNIERAKTYLKNLYETYTFQIESVQTVLATTIILRIQRDKVKHLAEDGVLEVAASCELAAGVDIMIGSLKDFYTCIKA